MRGRSTTVPRERTSPSRTRPRGGLSLKRPGTSAAGSRTPSTPTPASRPITPASVPITLASEDITPVSEDITPVSEDITPASEDITPAGVAAQPVSEREPPPLNRNRTVPRFEPNTNNPVENLDERLATIGEGFDDKLTGIEYVQYISLIIGALSLTFTLFALLIDGTDILRLKKTIVWILLGYIVLNLLSLAFFKFLYKRRFIEKSSYGAISISAVVIIASILLWLTESPVPG